MISYTTKSDIEILEHLFNLVKQVKKPIVKIFPDGRVIGTDEQFTSLNIVTSQCEPVDIGLFPCPPFVIMTKDITAFMREISKDYHYYNPKFDYPYAFVTRDKLKLDNHIELNYRIDELYNRVVSHELNKPIIYTEENFNTSVPEMFTLKASDGAKMYSFGVDKKFLMSSFNAIHPATKTEKVDLIIRDSDFYSYTAEFVIHKKKDKYDLHEILRFRKL